VHRAKIRAVTQFLSYFSKVIKIGYQGGKDGTMEFNESISYHFHNALKEITPNPEAGPKFEIEINKVVLSRGNIAIPEILTCAREGRQITLTWNNNLGEITNRYHDVIVLVAYTVENRSEADFNIGTRKAGKGIMTLPPEFINPVHLWVFYHNRQRSIEPSRDFISDSVYLGVM
jgi:hypothetical protein